MHVGDALPTVAARRHRTPPSRTLHAFHCPRHAPNAFSSPPCPLQSPMVL